MPALTQDPIGMELLTRKLRFRNRIVGVAAWAIFLALTTLMARRIWAPGFSLWGLPVFLMGGITSWFLAGRFVSILPGFFLMIRNKEGIASEPAIIDWQADGPLDATAVVMPIRNESLPRVFAGLRTMYRSLERTGQSEHFHFFILSDTDQPDCWVEEELSWAKLCAEVGGEGRIFYRRRDVRINAKQGNVADFLRRWGRGYRYMILLDADSVMTGPAMVKLVAAMENTPEVGIIATHAKLVFGETLLARLAQWDGRVQHDICHAAMQWLQPITTGYFGHNAIIRVEPFMEHCCLPVLPGREPLGGRILSHDYVEAALLRRAGWAVWLMPDFEGSYEEWPPTLLDKAVRDHRWCQGNFQYFWLIISRGFSGQDRLRLFFPSLRFTLGPFWLWVTLLALLGSVWHDTTGRAESFWSNLLAHGQTPLAATLDGILFVSLAVLCFAPDLLSVAATLSNPQRSSAYGGRWRMLGSAACSWGAFFMTEPIRLLFLSKSIITLLLGRGIKWTPQRRGGKGDGISWGEALRTHAEHTLFGVILGVAIWIFKPAWFWWSSPFIFGLMFAVLWAVFVSRPSIGHCARKLGLFLTPEEIQPPAELREIEQSLAGQRRESIRDADAGWLRALLDPETHGLHLSLLRKRRQSEQTRRYFGALCRRLLDRGPQHLCVAEKMSLLRDYESMRWLRWQLQVAPRPGWAADWQPGMATIPATVAAAG